MREVPESPTTGKADVRPWEAPDAFDKLTKTQQDVLGAAYIGQDLWQPRHVLEGLAKAGWLAREPGIVPGNPKGNAIDRLPIHVVRFVCPSWAAHMAWCAWCAEQPDDNDQAADPPRRP